MPKRAEVIRFGGLSNSVHETLIPNGKATSMDAASSLRGVLEGGPRYGSKSRRSGYNAADTGHGLFYAEYEGVSEYLAVVKPDGSSDATVYTVDPVSDTWTVVNNGSPVTNLDPSDWTFVQYAEKVYAFNETDGVWRRTIGASGTADAWESAGLTFALGATIALDEEPYNVYEFVSGDAYTERSTDTGYNFPNPDYFPTPGSIDTVNQHIEWTNPNTGSDNRYGQLWFAIDFNSAQDLSGVDYIGFEIAENAVSFGAASGSGYTFGPSNVPAWGGSAYGTGHSTWTTATPQVAVLESKSATFNDTFVSGLTMQSAEVVRYDTTPNYHKTSFRADISSIADADKDAVERIVFKIDFHTHHEIDWLRFQNLAFGRYILWDDASAAGKITYAQTFYDPTNARRSNAFVVETNDEADGGNPVYAPHGLGLKNTLTPFKSNTMFGAGFTAVEVWRKEQLGADAGKFARISYEALASASAVPADVVDTFAESNLTSQPSGVDLAIGNEFPASLSGVAAATWKQHMVVGDGPLVYFSFAGFASEFLPDPDSDFVPPDYNDLTQARTLYMSHGRAESMTGLVSQDTLYLYGRRGVYAMIGDSAFLASPPRLLPGSYGVLARHAAAPFRNGMVAASDAGLYYYETSRAFAGQDDDTVAVEEMTADVRDSWDRLLGTSGDNMVVTVWRDEIWCFNTDADGSRYLRLTKPSSIDGTRHWEEGGWFHVKRAVALEDKGLWGLGSDGTIYRMVRDSSGDAFTQDDGAPKTFTWTGGLMTGPRERCTDIYVVADGTPEITVNPDDGTKDPAAFTMTKVSGRIWHLNVNIMPGHQHQVTVSGTTGTDLVHALVLYFEDYGPGFGA